MSNPIKELKAVVEDPIFSKEGKAKILKLLQAAENDIIKLLEIVDKYRCFEVDDADQTSQDWKELMKKYYYE